MALETCVSERKVRTLSYNFRVVGKKVAGNTRPE